MSDWMEHAYTINRNICNMLNQMHSSTDSSSHYRAMKMINVYIKGLSDHQDFIAGEHARWQLNAQPTEPKPRESKVFHE